MTPMIKPIFGAIYSIKDSKDVISQMLTRIANYLLSGNPIMSQLLKYQSRWLYPNFVSRSGFDS